MKAKVIDLSDSVFSDAASSFSIVTNGYDSDLVRLEASDFLPRYNRIDFTVSVEGTYQHDVLMLSVWRDGTDIGSDNYYSFPLAAENLKQEKEYDVSILHFDAFNLPFAGIRVTIASQEEYESRKLAKAAFDRAKLQTLSIDEK